ncbi:hypothetical protein Hrd1104_03305 [Halorhabdus sp. CBA1104]|uniref:DUF7124 domain-containing protein n=1 Tax=unclassified Halorhabdus TaxID=2621901 RepID=UPI0012B1E495|nr:MULTISPECIES: hypothetical protein [unclassified Halorhabdus]QGN06418.1 hypothetical protein Hrd1104_03305 [Halorhabdus sp. CBA1104]
MHGDSGGEMTLAFDLDALQRFAHPDAVFNDARTWSEYVGIVSEEPTYVVTNFARKHRVRQDFFSGPRGRKDSLESVKGQFETPRYVYVGTDEDAKALANEQGWEYLDVEDAAEAAEWELGEPESPAQAEQDETREDWP